MRPSLVEPSSVPDRLSAASSPSRSSLLGLFNMLRGGSANRSQQLMRLRVLLQFVAIIDHHGGHLVAGSVSGPSI